MPSFYCSRSSCTAKTFVHLANRRYTTAAAARSNSNLDFLRPRTITRTSNLFSTRCRKESKSYAIFRNQGAITLSRSFSTSQSHNATVCVQNAQQDEDGNDMILEITPRAAKRLTEIMKKDSNPNLALRIQVESGGCHGFQYIMSLVTVPDAPSDIKADDSIFQFVSDGDVSTSPTEGAPKIILDEPSLDLLKGSKVDFTMELIGSQFKIVDNPLATSSCGCGTSFDIKM